MHSRMQWQVQHCNCSCRRCTGGHAVCGGVAANWQKCQINENLRQLKAWHLPAKETNQVKLYMFIYISYVYALDFNAEYLQVR